MTKQPENVDSKNANLSSNRENLVYSAIWNPAL